jgi:hypothetical protein
VAGKKKRVKRAPLPKIVRRMVRRADALTKDGKLKKGCRFIKGGGTICEVRRRKRRKRSAYARAWGPKA